jgi:GT2 family glycosyltransferase
MKIGAFIITFNRRTVLKQTIQLILDQTRPPDLILVVDNESSPDTEHIVVGLAPEKVMYHAMAENVGPAGAAAFALPQLSEQGCDWIYWGDDDDPPKTPDTLERLLRIIDCMRHHHDVAAVAAVGTRFDWKKGETIRLPDQALGGVIEVDSVGGNNQFILRREAIQAVGLPDRRLFIDFEDTEYCLRIRKAGYRLLIDGDLMREYRAKVGHLNQKQDHLQQPQKYYDSPWRRYYSTRNYIYSMEKTFQRPDLARREALKAFGRAVLFWKLGLKHGATLSSLQLRGVLDGYLGRMGRTVMPQPKYKGNA